MAKPKKKGKKVGVIDAIAKASGKKVTPEMARAVNLIVRNPEMRSFLDNVKTGDEQYFEDFAGRIKTDEQIQREQDAAYDVVRARAKDMQTSGANLSSAFSSAMGAAAGGLMGLAGGNAAAAQEIANTGASAATETGLIGTDLTNMGTAGGLQALLQARAGAENARSTRDNQYNDASRAAYAGKYGRLQALASLPAAMRGNALNVLTSLYNLANAGGGGGGGYGGGSGGGAGGGGVVIPNPLEAYTEEDLKGVRGLDGLIGGGRSTTTPPAPASTPVRGGGADTRLPFLVKESVARQVAAQTGAARGPVISGSYGIRGGNHSKRNKNNSRYTPTYRQGY